MAKVIIINSDGTSEEFTLQPVNQIGRHPNQTICLQDRVVSKSHAVINLSSGRYWVRDSNSRNGTFLNGEKVVGHAELKHGDEIKLGSTSLIFKDPAEEAVTSRDVYESIFIQEDKSINLDVHNEIDARDVNLEFRPEAEVVNESVLREDYEKLRAVYELSEASSNTVNLEELLELVLDKITDLTKASRAVILFEEDGEIRPVAARGIGEGADMNISKTIVQQVREKHIAIRTKNALMDSRFESSHSIILQGIVSIICVPLIFDSELLGIIYLDTQSSRNEFTEKDLKVITVFASQASSKIKNVRLAQKAKREEEARTQLSRLLSPNLVEEVVKGRAQVNLGGKLMDATVMFADIRGFTKLSEKLAPEMLMATLNQYFEIMVEVIFKYDGTLDKFIGDEIMAIWGAPIPQEDHGLRSIRAAYEIRERLKAFNEHRRAEGLVALEVGIGVNSGQMVAGYSGASQTLSYTVLGDAVNVASRLCSHAKPQEILISDALYPSITSEFTVDIREPVRFKGKSAEMGVYQIMGWSSGEIEADDGSPAPEFSPLSTPNTVIGLDGKPSDLV